MGPLEEFSDSIGQGDHEANLDTSTERCRAMTFLLELLEVFPDKIAVIELNGVLWSDWGRSERITESLAAIGAVPTFSLSAAAMA